MKLFYSQLPDTILSFLSAVPVISMYRLVLSENLVRDNRFGTYFDPTLALFPVIIEQNDLLQLLAMLWERKLQALSSRSKVNNNPPLSPSSLANNSFIDSDPLKC